MKIHDFRLYVRLSTTYIRSSLPYELYVFGYERHPDWLQNSTKFAVRLLTPNSSLVDSGRPLLGVGLVRQPVGAQVRLQAAGGNFLCNGLEILNLSDVTLQLTNASIRGRTTPAMNYIVHVRGLRQHGLQLPSDLAMAARVLEGHPTLSTSVAIYNSQPFGVAELLLLSPATAVSNASFSGYYSGHPIILELSARVSVEREVAAIPHPLTWCVYYFNSTSFTQPVARMEGCGILDYTSGGGLYTLQLFVSE
jgi:hypothetical protein